MKFIVITPPCFIADEARRIEELFDCGLDLLHLRKPGAAADDCSRLLDALPGRCRRRIVVHDNFGLCRDYGLAGIHLNRRNPGIPAFIAANREQQAGSEAFISALTPRYTVSASCHSIAEAAERKAYADYIFLSPIFDSISKEGYQAAYTPAELAQAAADGIIDNRVTALGGVTAACIRQLRQWHFGGAAFLGDVWSRAGKDDFTSHAKALADELHKLA